jgi:hypothetical protein
VTDPQTGEQLDDEIVVPRGTPLSVTAWLAPALALFAGSSVLLVWACGAVWQTPAGERTPLAILGALGIAAAVLIGVTGAVAYRELQVAATARHRIAVFASIFVLCAVALVTGVSVTGVAVALAGWSLAGADHPLVHAARRAIEPKRAPVLTVTAIVAGAGLVAGPLTFHLHPVLGVTVGLLVLCAAVLFGFALRQNPE